MLHSGHLRYYILTATCHCHPGRKKKKSQSQLRQGAELFLSLQPKNSWKMMENPSPCGHLFVKYEDLYGFSRAALDCQKLPEGN